MTRVRQAGEQPEPGPLTREGPSCLAPWGPGASKTTQEKSPGRRTGPLGKERIFPESPLLEGNCKGIVRTGKNTRVKRVSLPADRAGGQEGDQVMFHFLCQRIGSPGSLSYPLQRFVGLKHLIVLSKTNRTPTCVDLFSSHTKSIPGRLLARRRVPFASETPSPTSYTKTQPRDVSALQPTKTKQAPSRPWGQSRAEGHTAVPQAALGPADRPSQAAPQTRLAHPEGDHRPCSSSVGEGGGRCVFQARGKNTSACPDI